jgi:hypothetical protein
MMCGSAIVHSCAIRRLILADQDLREQVQSEERLRHRVQALQKASAIEHNKPQLDRATQELQEKEKLYQSREYELYLAECLNGPILKFQYTKLRRDATWFMREVLVRDCSDRGGCCGRQCGCCAKRHSFQRRRRGEGHCTTECECCTSFRGYEILPDEKDKQTKAFRAILDAYGSKHLLNLTNGYFAPVRPHKLFGTEWWKDIFGPPYYDSKVM